MKKLIGIILTAIGTVTAAFGLISQTSLAVISGADGPAAILFSGKIGLAPAIIGAVAGIALFVTGIYMIVGKNKSQSK